jgi:hypothetical protein
VRPAERDVVCERRWTSSSDSSIPTSVTRRPRAGAEAAATTARIFASGGGRPRARYYEVLHAVGSSVSPRREHCAIHVFAEQAADLVRATARIPRRVRAGGRTTSRPTSPG